LRRILLVLLALVALGAGSFWLLRGREEPRGPVVLAAASLQGSLDEATRVWASQGHPAPVLSFAASSVLARQAAAGAPADVFISADEEWMDTLAGKTLIRPASRATLLRNSLVLIAPAASKVSLDARPGFPLVAALDGGKLALADPQGVPAGRYARQALETLGVWDQVSGRVAAGDNVRAALALVARGEAPLGIVYATDAIAEPKVRIVATFPDRSHTPITYPVAVLTTARNADAQALRDFLLSAQAQAIFRRHGFASPAR
jgi:molybdate transport system substrate-binding protein